jgi:hypothetical protein
MLDKKTITYDTGQNRSYTSIQIQKMLGTNESFTQKIAMSLPFFIILFILLKIKYQKLRKIKDPFKNDHQ